MKELSEEECRLLLRTHDFGRMAVRGPDGLAIFPVNYAFSGDHVAIRTNPGTKLAAAAQNEVAFEIDDVDGESRTGWSVLVTGTAYEVTDTVDAESEELRRLAVDVWAGETSCWLWIEPRSITGRGVQAA